MLPLSTLFGKTSRSARKELHIPALKHIRGKSRYPKVVVRTGGELVQKRIDEE